jgi:hypothetical protein
MLHIGDVVREVMYGCAGILPGWGEGGGLRSGWHVTGKKEELTKKIALEGVCSSINI